MFKKISFFLFCFFVLIIPLVGLAQEDNKVNIYFFWAEGCPHCAKEEIFLDKLESKYKEGINLQSFEVSRDSDNARLLVEFGKELHTDVSGVPFLVVGEEHFTGFLSEETTGAAIESYLVSLLEQTGQNNQNSGENTWLENVKIPLLGQVNLKTFSLPVLTVFLGILDGFNPCAMWVLLFLISMLLGMKDRCRMWILGGSFIITSALVYFLFMAAWLNLILFLGLIVWVRILIGLVALGGGALNLREFFKNKEAACKVTGDEKRRRIFDRIKEVVSRRSFILAFGGIILLAVAVNMVELICSAGLPAVYSQVLVLNDLSTLARYGYIAIYIFFFMLDDMLVFVIAMITLHMTGISTKYSRYSSLIGGIIMLIIGILLIFKHQWLMFG
ncbi:MAG: hypothetical protein COV55_01820 [Candidatus Komeilibacteria bacterium CG11_big_fil_rev_8_21_14_0_20_36_20]|uniref:Uncharacterized protein n=1 Tax=Candidatus Komeilibacteria bacterium CG11_big_fil_rev_8_21_14_0_20_36_20 TaxID=1974477 RepID=A0A2H0NE28_9BACT|nr:MAG: hypothetical protein COV55_01820 [Candidatus Komeilibacteria bacterium CG11_big_fil_rev_8_21_14_0_20_36_20]PIR81281.1 MAG: hypothetical protein COU21_04805 [Candidatus Komeilibacteria bacterium CG10_big_fil_rev_8_21_14_0_10_36_65]PJC55245.1 MAG: hypothetical protein CO027_03745 [Candidatus Komeilibacteria bacterium CG_4_9_14_0_2_um_filter_36_13]